MLHIPHGTAHIRIPLCTRTMSHHRPWNSLVLYLGWTIGVRIEFALNSTSSYRFLSNYTHLTCCNFICQHSAITETTVKQHPLAVIWFDTHWESPGFVGIHAIFSGINTWRVITGYLVCSIFELASCIWPITLLTNRPCHGPWTGLGDSGTVWPCRPCIN